MSWSVVLVEDEEPARARLRRLLAAHPDFVIAAEAADGLAAVEAIDRLRPDLVLLDVRIPEIDGFEVLERATHQPRVIFTTAHDEHAVRAFEINSLDYLLKPFDAGRLAEALERARAVLAARAEAAGPASPPTRIPARRRGRILLLDPRDILTFETEGSLVLARTATDRVLVDRTLEQLEGQLGGSFFRAHRGRLVNLDRVAEIRRERDGSMGLVLRSDPPAVVPVSRRRVRALRERLGW